jgi:hypothetical protein
MSEIASAAIQSIVDQPIKSASNVVFTGGVATATAMDSVIGLLPTIGIVVGIFAQCYFIYCAYKKNKLVRIEIAEKSKRKEDK